MHQPEPSPPLPPARVYPLNFGHNRLSLPTGDPSRVCRKVPLLCRRNVWDGWFFTNGKGIHVTWEKTSDYGATRYYDDDGNEIKLNTGKTMVCILEDGDIFNVDDKSIESN